MASSAPSRDITETVCQSPDCSDPHKDPKLLPCLHRYCKVYLASVMKQASKKMFNCSVCNQDCEIPENRVDGFKTDLHMTNKLLLIKLQDSFENKHQNQLCGSCSEESTTPAYCFKCDKFLCQQCFQEHSETFEDHQPHTLKLETIKEKTLTLENLKPFTDPMCAEHNTERAQLCCYKCGAVPICVTCVTDEHNDHDIRDVVKLAKNEQKLLQDKLSDIDKQESDLYFIPSLVKAKKLQIECKRTQNKNKRESMVRDVETRREKVINKLRSKFEEDMMKLNQKYDQESIEVKAKHDKIEDDCQKKVENIDKIEQKVSKSVQLVNVPESIIDIGKQLMERNENIKTTSLSITDSQDVWSFVQCFPDIIKANESLLQRMVQALSELKFKQNGTFKCVQNCDFCTKHLDTYNQFTSHSRQTTYQTEGYITCESKNVIYLITCDICKKQYVGKTTESLKVRFAKHKNEVNSERTNERPLIAHFRSESHSTENMRLQGIKRFILVSSEILLTEEKKWMQELGTAVPHGLNKYGTGRGQREEPST